MEVDSNSQGQVVARKSSLLPMEFGIKAKFFRFFSFVHLQLRTVYPSWFSFLNFFPTTIVAPPLVPIIRDNLCLVDADIGNAVVASVSGSIFSRLAMGAICGQIGQRYGCASLVILTAPTFFCMSLVDNAEGYIRLCFPIGFSLATFASCLYWMSTMFNSHNITTVNGLVVGWGNIGGGATPLIMPLVFHAMNKCGASTFVAWRIAFRLSGMMHIMISLLICNIAF